MPKKAKPVDFIEAARLLTGGQGNALMRASRSGATWLVYAGAFRRFERWCAARGVAAMPASAETVRDWLLDLAGRGRKVATVTTYSAAVTVAHRLQGHPIAKEALGEVLSAIRRLHVAPKRQARPILVEELRALLAFLDTGRPIDTRDRALLALGWSAALRESEAVCIDWHRRGRGQGFVRLVEEGAVVTLVRSKASQSKPVSIIIPDTDMPTAVAALKAWAQAAELKPGDPVFCQFDPRGELRRNSRLAPDAVARIARERTHARLLAAGRSADEADEIAMATSGHSLRAGLASSLAQAGVPEFKIRARTRHKSAEQLATYVRLAEEWTASGLKEVGF